MLPIFSFLVLSRTANQIDNLTLTKDRKYTTARQNSQKKRATEKHQEPVLNQLKRRNRNRKKSLGVTSKTV